MGFFFISLKNKKWHSIFIDIRFWILFFFVLRLFAITDPPIESAHNWRQTTGSMVARNFIETDNQFLYPRIDFAGDKTGITPMEAPVLNYVIYLCAEVFGYKHWLGRLINLIISSVGLFYFFKILRLKFNKKTAFYAAFILTLSVWFTFSRKIMPDTFAMSLLFIGMYHGLQFFYRNKRIKDILFFGIFTMLGVASKLPVGYLLVIFIPVIFQNISNWKHWLIFGLSSIIAIAPSYLWYFIWNPHLINEFKFAHYFLGKDISQGFNELHEHSFDLFKRFYDTSLKYIGFGLFLIGLTFALIKKKKLILTVLSISFLGFFLIMLKSGETFTHHSYYIIPFTPVMALVAGSMFEHVKKSSIAILLITAFSVESILNHQDDFRVNDSLYGITHLEKDLNKVVPLGEKIAINCAPNPSSMYFAHRKGWIFTNEQISNENFLLDIQKNNQLHYIVILKRAFGTEISVNGQIIFSNKDYDIYKIDDVTPQ